MGSDGVGFSEAAGSWIWFDWRALGERGLRERRSSLEVGRGVQTGCWELRVSSFEFTVRSYLSSVGNLRAVAVGWTAESAETAGIAEKKWQGVDVAAVCDRRRL